MHLDRARAWAAGVGLALALSMWAAALTAPPAIAAQADEPVPVIVTYEMRKARLDARAAARDPKGFWIHQVAQRIEEKKPVLKHPLAMPLTAEVGFLVGRNGAILHSEIKRSSGNPAVDAEALAMVARAAPFPPMPDAVPDSQLAFELPLRFR